ncbi:MAG: DUF3106 domain-containing protein [Candidatus Acidiferrales bacterium]
MRRWAAIFVISAGLLLGLAAQSAQAQNGQRWRAWQARRAAAAQRQRANENGARQPGANGEARKPNPRAMAGLPPKWVDNLRDMPPDQQERFMQNNEKFQSLPPERQAQIRKNLEKWNSLTPEQQNRIKTTERMLENLTPEQREHFRNDIVPTLAAMPPGRRARVIGHWRRLQGMTPEQQQAALNDPRFMQGLSPDEQGMVRDLNSLGAPPPQ